MAGRKVMTMLYEKKLQPLDVTSTGIATICNFCYKERFSEGNREHSSIGRYNLLGYFFEIMENTLLSLQSGKEGRF
jgi:hypothetical protein